MGTGSGRASRPEFVSGDKDALGANILTTKARQDARNNRQGETSVGLLEAEPRRLDYLGSVERRRARDFVNRDAGRGRR